MAGSKSQGRLRCLPGSISFSDTDVVVVVVLKLNLNHIWRPVSSFFLFLCVYVEFRSALN